MSRRGDDSAFPVMSAACEFGLTIREHAALEFMKALIIGGQIESPSKISKHAFSYADAYVAELVEK